MVEQETDTIAEQVHRCFEAGHEHEAGGGSQLAIGQVAAVERRPDQLADEVVAGIPAQFGQVAAEPDMEAPQAHLGVAETPIRQTDVEAGRGQLAQVQHQATVGGSHTKQIADDRHRQYRAVRVDDVGRGAIDGGGGDLVEQSVGGARHLIAQPGYRPCGEHARTPERDSACGPAGRWTTRTVLRAGA